MTDARPEVQRAVEHAVARHRQQPGPLLLVLHDIQHALGCIPEDAQPLLAAAMNLSRAEVHGVITFYHHFRQTPAGRHTIHLCRAEACQSMNANGLQGHVERTLGVGFHETTVDGAFTLEPVYCLGNCALAPSMMIDGKVYGRVTPSRCDAVLQQWRSQA